MNNDVALLLWRVATDLGLDVRSYSGRCMYGAECVGIDCDNPLQVLAQLTVGLCEGGDEGLEAAEHLTRDGAVKTDSMGRGSILYFPRLPWDAVCEDACPTSEDPDSDRDAGIEA